MNKLITAMFFFVILLTVSAVADVTVTNQSLSLESQTGSSALASLQLVNTGSNSASVTFSNFTLTHSQGYLLQIANPGPITVSAGATVNVPISISIPPAQPIGSYSGRINMAATSGSESFSDSTGIVLTVGSPAPTADFDVPTSVKLGSSSTRFNSSVSTQITMTNTGTVTLTNIHSSIAADAKYRLQLTGLPLSLQPGQSATITLNGFVPGDVSGTTTAGTISFISDQLTRTIAVDVQGQGALTIRRVRFDWDGSGDSVDDGETVDNDIPPGSEVTLRVEFENLYTNSEDIDIDNVDVDITVENIDDGDDIDDSFDFDIRADDREEVTMTFDVPIDADEDTYTVDIRAEGEDDNGNVQIAEARVHFRVERERHDVRVTRFTATPSEVSCSPRSITLSYELVNYGRDDEDSISLGIRQPTLGIELNQFNIELSNDLDESDSRYRRDVRYTIPDSVRPGTYQIELTAFNNNDFSAFQTADVVVGACQDTVTPPVTPPPVTPPTGPTVPAEPTGSVTGPTTSLSGNLPLILVLAGLNIVLLVVIVAVLGRRR